MWYLKYKNDAGQYLEVWTEDTYESWDPKTGDKVTMEDAAKEIGEKQNQKAAALRRNAIENNTVKEGREYDPNPYELVHVEHMEAE